MYVAVDTIARKHDADLVSASNNVNLDGHIYDSSWYSLSPARQAKEVMCSEVQVYIHSTFT